MPVLFVRAPCFFPAFPPSRLFVEDVNLFGELSGLFLFRIFPARIRRGILGAQLSVLIFFNCRRFAQTGKSTKSLCKLGGILVYSATADIVFNMKCRSQMGCVFSLGDSRNCFSHVEKCEDVCFCICIAQRTCKNVIYSVTSL